MTPFEAATHELLGCIAEVLDGAMGDGSTSRKRIAVLKNGVESLVRNLIIDQGYPELPDAPVRDIQKAAKYFRQRLTEIAAAEEKVRA